MGKRRLHPSEILEVAAEIEQRVDALREMGSSELIVTALLYYSQPAAIGFEPGQVRPGEDGSHDLYSYLEPLGLSNEELMIATGFSKEDLAEKQYDTKQAPEPQPDHVAGSRRLLHSASMFSSN